jgi:uncharacterized protein
MLTTSRKKVVLAFLLIFILIMVLPVNAEIVSDEWKNEIEAYLQQVDANTTAEIVVYAVQSLRGHGIKREGSEINEIVQLGVYIFNELPLDTPNGPVVGIGKKGKDNGVLVLVAIEEREWRIEVGYGLEGDITDIESNLIAQQYLIPKFQEGKYGEGLYDTVVALAQEIPASNQVEPSAIRGRYFYENVNPPAKDETPLWILVLITTVGIVIIIVVIYLAKKGKTKVKKSRDRGRRGGGYGGSGGARRPSRVPKGGGGRSGGGGSKGKW